MGIGLSLTGKIDTTIRMVDGIHAAYCSYRLHDAWKRKESSRLFSLLFQRPHVHYRVYYRFLKRRHSLQSLTQIHLSVSNGCEDYRSSIAALLYREYKETVAQHLNPSHM